MQASNRKPHSVFKNTQPEKHLEGHLAKIASDNSSPKTLKRKYNCLLNKASDGTKSPQERNLLVRKMNQLNAQHPKIFSLDYMLDPSFDPWDENKTYLESKAAECFEEGALIGWLEQCAQLAQKFNLTSIVVDLINQKFSLYFDDDAPSINNDMDIDEGKAKQSFEIVIQKKDVIDYMHPVSAKLESLTIKELDALKTNTESEDLARLAKLDEMKTCTESILKKSIEHKLKVLCFTLFYKTQNLKKEQGVEKSKYLGSIGSQYYFFRVTVYNTLIRILKNESELQESKALVFEEFTKLGLEVSEYKNDVLAVLKVGSKEYPEAMDGFGKMIVEYSEFNTDENIKTILSFLDNKNKEVNNAAIKVLLDISSKYPLRKEEIANGIARQI